VTQEYRQQDMKFLRGVAGYKCIDHQRNTDIRKRKAKIFS